MNKIIMFGIFLITCNSFAASQICVARKSITWFGSDDRYHVRKAETKVFKVVATEHEVPYSLEFFEENGTKWDEVEIMTGTILGNPVGDVFQVVADIKNLKGELVSYLALVADKDSKFSRAITTIDLPGTDLDPSLTVECKLE